MKNNIKKLTIFTTMFMLLFCNKVYAYGYELSFTTDSEKTLKNGDIVELNGGIACISSEPIVSKQKFTFIYDKNVFELVKYDNGKAFKTRDGWTDNSQWDMDGRYVVEVFAPNSNDYITEDVASNDCDDSKNATLVSIRLKVKKVDNQNTKVQLLNEMDAPINDQIPDMKEIEFTIHNKSANNDLSSLKVEGYELDNDFSKNRIQYEIYVPYNVEKVNIVASANDSNAKVSGTGETQLTVGDNKVNIVVTAENGAKKTYTINIIRKLANDDTALSKVSVVDSNKARVDLLYDEKTKTYTGKVNYEITFVSFDIKCSGDECFVSEMNPESLQAGRNEFNFTVTSQNGDEEEYKIVINKDEAKKDNTVLYLSVGLGISILLCIVLLALYLKNKNK